MGVSGNEDISRIWIRLLSSAKATLPSDLHNECIGGVFYGRAAPRLVNLTRSSTI